MAGIEQLAVTATTATLVVAVVGYVLTARDWRRTPDPDDGDAGDDEYSLAWAEDVLHSPTAWTLGFVASAGVAGLAAVSFVGGTAAVGGVPSVLVGATFGVLVGALLFLGTYASIKNRGYGRAIAVMVGSWALGGATVLGIVVKLFLESP